jgi:hypothetical protein
VRDGQAVVAGLVGAANNGNAGISRETTVDLLGASATLFTAHVRHANDTGHAARRRLAEAGPCSGHGTETAVRTCICRWAARASDASGDIGTVLFFRALGWETAGLLRESGAEHYPSTYYVGKTHTTLRPTLLF